MSDGTDRGPGPPADPVAGWAASGAMWLTGHPDGPPLSPAAAVVPALEDAAAAFTRLSGERGAPVVVDVGEMLTGRAALLRLRRRGRTSPNGSCRLLRTADGWAAVNLARPSDVEAVGALIEGSVEGDPRRALARAAARMGAAELVARSALLGLPAAELPATGPQGAALAWPTAVPFALHRLGEAGPPRADGRPLVVDLSAMWAGPLCAHLLGRAGMRVVKVESSRRPDGARAGHAGFFGWLHAGHASVALDLSSGSGRARLAQLVDRADVVIESSRPRALAQLGIDAGAAVAARPGRTWLSITGYGRLGEAGRRVAFGDDAAVAAGLVGRDDEGAPVFCGDAIADPITGMYAAVAALTSLSSGGGHLAEVAMVDAVAATLITPTPPRRAHRSPAGDWAVRTADGDRPVLPPAVPRGAATAAARPLGADTGRVLAELRIAAPC